MGTVQHLFLFEHITGFGLFRVKEFDEITRSFKAHPNAFIKPVAFVHFKSVQEAVENVQTIVNGNLSDLLRQFLRRNVPPVDCVLGVSDEKLGKCILACDFGFECIWHGSVHEVLRVIRQSFARLTRSLITQPGAALSLPMIDEKLKLSTSADELKPGPIAESRARVVVSLARARLQLGIEHHLADTGIVKVLMLIDELDNSLTRSASRLRACYSIHFPEVCRPHFKKQICLDDMDLVQLIANSPLRSSIISNFAAGSFTYLGSDELASLIATAAQDSVGAELSEEDCENLQKYAQRLLQMNEAKQRYVNSLSRRITSLCPNLHALLHCTLHSSDEAEQGKVPKANDNLSSCLVTARLIANAGSFNRLASMPSTRLLSLGASKGLFRKGGAVVATSTGLLSNATKILRDPKLPTDTDNLQPATASISAAELKSLSANRVQRNTVHRRAARLLADKSVLACRADCFRQHNPIYQQQGLASQPCVSVMEDERLKSGAYGQYLGKTVQEHLRIWAEKNGIHTDKTEEQKKAQRERRKKYRKLKRKAWFTRKLSRCTEKQLSDGIMNDIESMDVDSDDPTQLRIVTSQLINDGDVFNDTKKTGDNYNTDLNGRCLVNPNELLNSSEEKSCFRKKSRSANPCNK
ncbi:putative nucleolar protein NOP56 [Schistosoma mansoni]|uniref:Nucleolar protein 56 n=1 Tax=Schistosoma mansoni TaxID=6183 RepID=G4VRK3_SCHMA|nr:putative nucleolar protein NOP56 [Schistosoma mansoni]|eukprot:XP_018654272.1 putative nucleolar protein NOP56 [Schistosoma mansoni]